MIGTVPHSVLRAWWTLPVALRWVLLLSFFAATCAITASLRWGELPATPFYVVILLAVALGTERQSYVMVVLSVAASLALSVLLHTAATTAQETTDSALLALVGGVLVVAMRQRHSAERLMKEVAYETGVLRALGNYALTRLSREEMMKVIVRYLANSSDASYALLAIPDAARTVLRGYADANGQGHGVQPVARPIEGSLAGAAFHLARPLVVPDTAQEPLFVSFDEAQIGAAIAVPLLLAGQPIGALLVGKKETGGFGPEDVKLVEILARTIAVPLYASRPARTAEAGTQDSPMV